VPGPTPNTDAQAGKTKTTGVELEWVGRVTSALELNAFYNYTDIDPALEALPEHNAGVWAKYSFMLANTPGFSAGLGVRYMSSFRDPAVDLAGNVLGFGPRVPSLTLFDAMLAWESPRWRYALNVANLGDKVYTSTCLSRGDCWYGARRTAVLSASYRF
jgi:iron complex outermembrane receptor protein